LWTILGAVIEAESRILRRCAHRGCARIRVNAKMLMNVHTQAHAPWAFSHLVWSRRFTQRPRVLAISDLDDRTRLEIVAPAARQWYEDKKSARKLSCSCCQRESRRDHHTQQRVQSMRRGGRQDPAKFVPGFLHPPGFHHGCSACPPCTA
jgi:hypothetical protein